jgi:hypothetical protein
VHGLTDIVGRTWSVRLSRSSSARLAAGAGTPAAPGRRDRQFELPRSTACHGRSPSSRPDAVKVAGERARLD